MAGVADLIDRLDEIMDRAEESFNRIMGRIGIGPPTRPIGSTEMPRGEMLADFRAIALDTDGLTLRREELTRALGPAEGTKQFARWYREMMRGG